MRKVCYYDDFGVVCKMFLNLIGYFIDLVGFFLFVVIYLMIFLFEEIKEGVVYFGFGIDDECYLLLYYWFFLVIVFLDYDYE